MEKREKISVCDEIEMEALRLHRGETQSCIWSNHNSTFTLLSDLTALKRQCLWPSCRIPISEAYATVETKREQGLYSAPGLSDYCLKTRVFCPWQREDRHRGRARPQLFFLSPGWGFWRAHLIAACAPAFSHPSYAVQQHSHTEMPLTCVLWVQKMCSFFIPPWHRGWRPLSLLFLRSVLSADWNCIAASSKERFHFNSILGTLYNSGCTTLISRVVKLATTTG